jgi:Tfp pilus assembly protein FimT
VPLSCHNVSFINDLRRHLGGGALLVVVGLIGVVTAISIPVFFSSNQLTDVWTSAERVGALIRQTRLKAISQNTTYVIRFSCPAAGQIRALRITGDPTIDDLAANPDRCAEMQTGDSDVLVMASGVDYATDAATGLQITGRGVFTTVGGGSVPMIVSVTSSGTARRYIRVSITGQIAFSDTDPHEIDEEDDEP